MLDSKLIRTVAVLIANWLCLTGAWGIDIRDVKSFGVDATMPYRILSSRLRISGFTFSELSSGDNSGKHRAKFSRGADYVTVLTSSSGQAIWIYPCEIDYRGQKISIGDRSKRLMQAMGPASKTENVGAITRLRYDDYTQMTFIWVSLKGDRITQFALNPSPSSLK